METRKFYKKNKDSTKYSWKQDFILVVSYYELKTGIGAIDGAEGDFVLI